MDTSWTEEQNRTATLQQQLSLYAR